MTFYEMTQIHTDGFWTVSFFCHEDISVNYRCIIEDIQAKLD